MYQVLIIADDLTGAADTAAGFAKNRLVTLVALDCAGIRECPPCDVLAVSTETRDASQEEAARRNREMGARLHRTPLVYKKMDSTLRGNPGVELVAIMDAQGTDSALVAPAFPEQGRTTVEGHQWVDGVRCSNVVKIFREASGGRPVYHVPLGGEVGTSGIFVGDAESNEDLLRLARVGISLGMRVFCGSAGLAHALAKAMPIVSKAPPPEPPTWERGRPILVLAGSRHPRTVHQVEFARQKGVAIIQPPQSYLLGSDDIIRMELAEAEAYLRHGKDVILTTTGMQCLLVSGRALAARFARAACALIQRNKIGGLVLTGGDIVAAACSELRARFLWLCEEVQPGIPSGILLDGTMAGLPVVTKAGGFGNEEALMAAVERLRA